MASKLRKQKQLPIRYNASTVYNRHTPYAQRKIPVSEAVLLMIDDGWTVAEIAKGLRVPRALVRSIVTDAWYPMVVG